jgi:hypothetical protein
MRHRRQLLHIAAPSLLVVCITLLVVHGIAGHAHSDLLASVPVAEHVPGDDHHDATGGSCELARTPDVDVATSQPALPSIALLVAPKTVSGAAFDEDQPAARPPLFLLHATLLI